MTRKKNSTLFPMVFTLVLGFCSTGVSADIASDYHVQSDRLISADLSGTNVYGVSNLVATGHLEYVKSMISEGYPLRSIVLHSATQGISISDTAYLLTLADPQNAQEVYDSTIELMKDMPGWVCGEHLDPDIRYPIFYEPSRLGSSPRVSDVAFNFFERAEMAGFKDASGDWGFPDVSRKQFLFSASVDELINLKKQELANDSSNGWWYQVGRGREFPGENGTPVMVGLYKFDRTVVIDATLGQLQEMRGSGRVPVAVVYNDSTTLPVSRSCKVPDDSSEPLHAQPTDLTIDRVIENYHDCGRRVTPPREWHTGDYHLMVPTSRLAAIFGLPRSEDVPGTRWERLEAELTADGFVRPVLVTLNRASRLAWASDRDKVAVAESLGIEEIPVVFFYHDIVRENCGSAALCGEQVCRAVVSAAEGGFSPSQCKEADDGSDGSAGVVTASDSGSAASGVSRTGAETQDVRNILNQAADQRN